MDRRHFLAYSSLGILGIPVLGCLGQGVPLLKKGQVIACFGDSITYGNGEGYVEMLQEHATKNRPEMGLTFLNWGKSSETVTGLTEEEHPGPRPYLFERLDALLESRPIDLALFCYGINCGIYGKPSARLFDSFTTGIYTFLEKLKQRNIKALLLTPPPLVLDVVPIQTKNTKRPYGYLNPYPEYEEKVLQPFTKIVLQLRHSQLIARIDIHTPLLENRGAYYDKDPIHPNIQGHRCITETLIHKLGI
ncbi:MAG: GDSL-type esterase/lipase family protein [Bacteroidota bacterium]